MVKVKICGITNPDDALAAADAGADSLGFVFYKGSPRYIDPREAGKIIRGLPLFVTPVGVFVNETAEAVEEIAGISGIQVIQLHGEEPPDFCRRSRPVIKAVRVRSLQSLNGLESFQGLAAAFLLDAYAPDAAGGTGLTFNWDIAGSAKRFGRIILAGGLTTDNIAGAVRHVRPFGVDVSSGVEKARGRKDHAKVRLFIQRAKAALGD